MIKTFTPLNCVINIMFQALGGNIVTACPISDLNPLLQAAGCVLTVISHGELKVFVYCRLNSIDVKFMNGHSDMNLTNNYIVIMNPVSSCHSVVVVMLSSVTYRQTAN